MASPHPTRRELAFETLTRYFTEFDGSIKQLSDRAGNLSAISGFLVTFAAAAGLIGKDAERAFPLWASVALVAIVFVQTLVVLCILWPRTYFHGPDVPKLLEEGGEWLTEPFLQGLITRHEENGKRYRRRVAAYMFALFLLMMEVIVILVAVLMRDAT